MTGKMQVLLKKKIRLINFLQRILAFKAFKQISCESAGKEWRKNGLEGLIYFKTNCIPTENQVCVFVCVCEEIGCG